MAPADWMTSAPGEAGFRPHRTWAFAAAAVMAVLMAACGGSAGSSVGTTGLVTAPDFTLQGCTYAPNNSVPPGEPQGLRPSFASFSPDPSANTAVRSIEEHGGKAVVDSAGVPPGTTLYAGPDRSGTVVGTVPHGQSVLVAEPLLWQHGGDTWLAFFLECGGPDLYWASLSDIRTVSPQTAADISALIAQLEKAPPYTTSHEASLLDVTVDDGHLEWTAGAAAVPFPVARGQLIQQAG